MVEGLRYRDRWESKLLRCASLVAAAVAGRYQIGSPSRAHQRVEGLAAGGFVSRPGVTVADAPAVDLGDRA